MGGEHILYIDILFIINFTMDFIILWATSKFTGFNTTIKRLIMAALIGACYSITVYFPTFHSAFSSLATKFLFSLVMIFIVFYPQPFKKMIQALAYFYLIVFAAGGAMLAAIYLLDTQYTIQEVVSGSLSFVEPLGYNWLLAAVIAAIVIGRYGAKYIKKNYFKNIMQVPVVICFGEKKVALKTMVDTGNQLSDPITGKPVMIAELDALKDIIPKETYYLLEKNRNSDVNTIINILAESPLASRVRVIPFKSIGKQKGMLVGIRPDSVIIINNEETIKIKDIIVGIYNYKLSSKGSYKGLLHPELIQ